MKVISAMLNRWAYLLTLVPFISDWLETGHFPSAPRELITELVLGLLAFVCISLIYHDIDRLRWLAQSDVLTGLYNRRKFMDDLERQAALARRLKSPLSLVFFDIDAFKAINDTYGHAEGDRVLHEVATVLKECARRQVDAVYRLGGDEFALVLVGVGASAAAEWVRQTLQMRLTQRQALRHHGVTLSYGIAALTQGERAEDLLHRADTRMYETKRQRRRAAILSATVGPLKVFETKHPPRAAP